MAECTPVALVAGAGRGLGSAVAGALAAEGFAVPLRDNGPRGGFFRDGAVLAR
jgi:NAD(P)-dependent dehydrogenase (short-subunit alcohol dehydrogenase family)